MSNNSTYRNNQMMNEVAELVRDAKLRGLVEVIYNPSAIVSGFDPIFLEELSSKYDNIWIQQSESGKTIYLIKI